MTSQNLDSEEINYQYHKIILIQVGDYHFQEKIPIICPFEKEDGKSHIITKNGHDSSVKGHPQQYRCKTCHASFYGHTSKNFQQIQENIPDCLVSIFSKGDLTLKKLGIFFNIPYHTTSRLLEAFLRHAAENMWDFTPFYEKMRKSNVLIVDETFLTIDGESWYLIIAISGNNKIMGFCISKSRNFNVMFPFINKCADKLEDGLEILVTDGFRTYQKVAEQWGEDIIHVRHIHKPPYGWAFVDIHHYDNEAWYRVSLRIRNDILVNSNGFLAEVYVKRDYLVYKKDIPKIPKNQRSLMSQDLETILKHYKQDGRRKKPPNKTWKKSHFSYFIVDLKEGRVTCLDKNLDTVAAKLEKLLPFFAKKHITSNLIEKENSIIKKCICFGAKRNLEKWERLVEIYFAIRDEPKLLRNLCAGLRIPKQMVTKLAPRLINIKM